MERPGVSSKVLISSWDTGWYIEMVLHKNENPTLVFKPCIYINLDVRWSRLQHKGYIANPNRITLLHSMIGMYKKRTPDIIPSNVVPPTSKHLLVIENRSHSEHGITGQWGLTAWCPLVSS